MMTAEKPVSNPRPAQAETIVMTKEKDCKGSVKYSTQDPDAVITNVYVSRSWARPMPESVTITIK